MRKILRTLALGAAFLFVAGTALGADSKLTGLTADTTPTTDDLVYTVNSPGGTPADRKVTIGDIISICRMESFQIIAPAVTDDFMHFRAPANMTITYIRGILQSGVDSNVVGGFDECDANGAACVAVDSDITFDNEAGSATADPPNDATGVLEDSASGWTDDLHNACTLVMTSGTASGNTYTIDDTVAISTTIACTGDNLYSDGVRSGDTYEIWCTRGDDGTLTNPSIDSGDWVRWHTTSVSAAGYLTVTVYYTID